MTDWAETESLWEDGYFSTVASQLGGAGVSAWLLVAAALANMGLYLAEIAIDESSAILLTLSLHRY